MAEFMQVSEDMEGVVFGHKHQLKDSSTNGNEISATEEYEILKKKISCHSLYGLLLDSHLACLKMCVGNEGIQSNNDMKIAESQMVEYSCSANQLELDQFMNAYCNILKKLKEGMEEPQRESMEFINYMHSQLKELIDQTPLLGAFNTEQYIKLNKEKKF